jgi:DNA polymerase
MGRLQEDVMRHPKERVPVFVDYEMFWDVRYSLGSPKLSTTDYIHDPRAAIHGAAVAIADEEPKWLRGLQLLGWLRNARDKGHLFVAHHTLFDGYITTYTHGLEFQDYFCTMGMIDALFQGGVGRGLDEAMTTLLGWKSGKTDILKRTKGRYWDEFTDAEKKEMEYYAKDDLLATQELYYKFADNLPRSEWAVMSTILKMFCHPRLQFDDLTLRSALKNAQDDRDSRIENALALFNCTEDDLRKNTFVDLLESCGITVPLKPSPTTKDKMIPALAKTDQGFQDLLEHNDPRVAALAAGRLAVKSTQGITRAQRFLDLHESVGYLPVAYNYYRAHTGRLSGANKINLANLKQGSDLRKSIIAPKGYVLAVCDSSQIECRDNGYLAGQDDLMDLFREKKDPYNDMASAIFGRDIDRHREEDYLEGFIGKTAVLGLGFQMGSDKFKHSVEVAAKTRLGIDYEITIEEAGRVVDVYRRKNYKIKDSWNRYQDWLFQMTRNGDPFYYDYGDGALHIKPKEKRIFFPNGTSLYYPCLSWDDGSFTYVTKLGRNYVNKYIYGGKLCENIVQKHSRDIVAWQMLQIAERYQVVLHTYDENVALVPESEADEGMAWITDIMKTAPSWAAGLPLDAKGGYAKEYSK